MLQQVQEPEVGLRYDAQMQRRVVELAARLQQEDQDRQTVHQIVDAAREIGLEPEYVQRAIAQIQAEKAVTPTIVRAETPPVTLAYRAEYRRFVTAMVAPMGLGALAFALKDVIGLAVLFSVILPIPLSCLLGFLTGRKRVGFVTGMLLIIALMPTIYHLGIHNFYRAMPRDIYQPWFQGSAHTVGQQAAFLYTFLGLPMAGLLGLFGAWTRQRYLPHPAEEPKTHTTERRLPSMSAV
jgi:hypothetical protein